LHEIALRHNSPNIPPTLQIEKHDPRRSQIYNTKKTSFTTQAAGLQKAHHTTREANRRIILQKATPYPKERPKARF